MLLTCDIGNTNIKSGLFENDKLSDFRIFDSPDNFINYASSVEVNQLAISSVVPSISEKIIGALQNKLNIFLITKDADFNIELNYDTLNTLGVDRICSCEGAFSIYKNSSEFLNYKGGTFLLTIDFGTATTINIIKYPAEFIGGIIAPGIRLMSEALQNKTAQLPQTGIKDYYNFIGRTTQQSIASGILNSTLSLIDKTIIHLRKEHKADKIFIFLTGGNAEDIMPHLSFDFIFEKGLVLYGIKAAFEKNKRSSGLQS